MCWVSWNYSCTLTPTLIVEDLCIPIKKQPSADAKPANHWGSAIVGFTTKGLTFGVTFGKAVFKRSDKPRFIEAFNPTILCNPERVKCCLLITR